MSQEEPGICRLGSGLTRKRSARRRVTETTQENACVARIAWHLQAGKRPPCRYSQRDGERAHPDLSQGPTDLRSSHLHQGSGLHGGTAKEVKEGTPGFEPGTC